MKIGKARFGGGSQRKYFKLKDGEQAYRILPPLGELADAGRWSVFHSVHYGYATSDGRQKPFLSPEVKNRKSGMIEVRDAAKERIQSLKAKLDEAKKTDNKPVFDKLDALVGQEGKYNLDNNHYMNVVDAQGNIGILKLRHRAKLALDVEIKKLNAKGVDPLSVDNGRFFVFTRSGMGRDTTFAVNVLQEELKNVPGVGDVTRDVVHVLNEETQSRLSTEAAELDKVFKRLSSEEVSKVVETADIMTGVSKYLDELYAKSSTTAQSQGTEGHDEDEDSTDSDSTPTSQPMTKTSAPATTEKPAAKLATQSLADMSNDDFLAALQNGTL